MDKSDKIKIKIFKPLVHLKIENFGKIKALVKAPYNLKRSLILSALKSSSRRLFQLHL